MMWIVWLLVILLILLLAYAWAIRPNLPRRDISSLMGVDYAHRGLWGGDVPENSLAAFSRAVEAGFAIETDLHLSNRDLEKQFWNDVAEMYRMYGIEEGEV